jgi:hypothetical protein
MDDTHRMTPRPTDPIGENEWEEIHGFTSPGEFIRFEHWLRDAVDEGALVEVEVGERYNRSTIFEERWFKTPAGRVWRIVAPDFPFTGVFLRVESEQVP